MTVLELEKYTETCPGCGAKETDGKRVWMMSEGDYWHGICWECGTEWNCR